MKCENSTFAPYCVKFTHLTERWIASWTWLLPIFWPDQQQIVFISCQVYGHF